MTQEAFNQAEALTRARMDIAVHNAKITALSDDMAELKAAFEAQAKVLQEVLTALSEARGGWRTLMWVGGAGLSLGGLFAAAIDHFVKRGG